MTTAEPVDELGLQTQAIEHVGDLDGWLLDEYGMFVREDARGEGVGRALLDAGEELGLAGQVGADAAKAKIEKIYTPPKAEGAEMIEGSTDEVVQKLVAKIKELGLL